MHHFLDHNSANVVPVQAFALVVSANSNLILMSKVQTLLSFTAKNQVLNYMIDVQLAEAKAFQLDKWGVWRKKYSDLTSDPDFLIHHSPNTSRNPSSTSCNLVCFKAPTR